LLDGLTGRTARPGKPVVICDVRAARLGRPYVVFLSNLLTCSLLTSLVTTEKKLTEEMKNSLISRGWLMLRSGPIANELKH